MQAFVVSGFAIYHQQGASVLISMMKKTVFGFGVAVMGLSVVPSSSAEEMTEREMAVTLVAAQRACTHVYPGIEFTIQNAIDDPEMQLPAEVGEEALLAEKSPEYQKEIRLAQDPMEQDVTGRAALGLMCSFMKPPKRFWQ